MSFDLQHGAFSQSLAALPSALRFGSFLLLFGVIAQCLRAVYKRFGTHQNASRATTPQIKHVHSQTFPPSQRRLLASIDARFTPDKDDIDPSELSKSVLEMDADYRRADPKSFLFSGIRVGEVLALGDFPNYAALSEVPLPEPLEDFDINATLPRPYRPFRWPYHQTMAIQRMEPDYWIELESTYLNMVQHRLDIFAQYGKDVLRALPGSELACKELMEMVIQFLCARYPRQFSLEGRTFVNGIRGKSFELDGGDPLMFLLENVPEDFAIMLRDPETGSYRFRAGVICASTGWSLGTKIGLGLPGIHSPVPDYKEKMEMSMDRFFTKMPTNKPVQRGAWGFEVGQHLYVPPGHPELSRDVASDPSVRPEDLFFRVDWQTLRRLPLSGAIVFNFKAYFYPVAELRDEPYVPSLALKVVSDSKGNLLQYKKTAPLAHMLHPLLQEFERHQMETGLMEADWEHRTLEENPFFPGWREKWTRQQAELGK
ncbi:alpha-1,2-mannosyltransferase [Purpureocillium lilacinum]|uniref:Alpha-1,2-mannosyltransferase n=2 Tax=Purpureocillium lilacinum TaxID=33203 RepID=A0A179HR95_PURLI|nr:alpha-1,2-mannosyltransferase [Purpureocillium lilacinum]OAQ79258.1 alpha-1,2-mannosyltransferase [Purpureocillium lilacinum]OAQ92985.1 alpha-1,2-mannosyltransferase [Purpureocillium lilacinum]